MMKLLIWVNENGVTVCWWAVIFQAKLRREYLKKCQDETRQRFVKGIHTILRSSIESEVSAFGVSWLAKF